MNDQVTNADLHSRLQFLMFLHLFLDQLDSFCRDITPIVIEAFELSKQREECISYTASKLIVVAAISSELIVIFEVRNFGHLSFEVGSILEEIALMKLVKFIPYFLTTRCHLFVILL